MNLNFGEVALSNQQDSSYDQKYLHNKKLVVLMLFIFNVQLLTLQSFAVDVELYQQNKKASEQIKDKKAAVGLSELFKIIPKYPNEFILNNNIGNSLELLGQQEKALQFYQKSYDLSKPKTEEQFIALFNKAQLLAQQKKVDEALLTYQQALKIKPESVETKTNIELLTQNQGGQGGSDDQQKQQQQQNQQDDKNQSGKDYEQNKQYKPKPFQGKDLSESDVKKIFDELKQQEQKIRKEYNKDQNSKESDNGKSW